jgi:hypothetical protein
MTRILIAFCLGALAYCALDARAAPFLVSDPSTDATIDVCAYQEGTIVTRTPTVAGACHADLAAVSQGAHSITVWFESSLWGTASASVPFSYKKPAGNGTGPGNLGVSKQ